MNKFTKEKRKEEIKALIDSCDDSADKQVFFNPIVLNENYLPAACLINYAEKINITSRLSNDSDHVVCVIECYIDTVALDPAVTIKETIKRTLKQ